MSTFDVLYIPKTCSFPFTGTARLFHIDQYDSAVYALIFKYVIAMILFKYTTGKNMESPMQTLVFDILILLELVRHQTQTSIVALTHLGRDKMTNILQTIFSGALSINIWLKFVPEGKISNIPALVLIMTWRPSGDKPLFEPMMISILTHKCAILSKFCMYSIIRNWHHAKFATVAGQQFVR